MPSEEERACPYCEGKGYVSVEEYSEDNNDFGEVKTWVRKNCPLCGGVGHLVDDKESNTL
jgi:hypothetical protein